MHEFGSHSCQLRSNAVTILFSWIVCASVWAQNKPITLDVDATDAPRRLLHAQLRIPAAAGKLTLLYPKWIPGEHGPTGPITDLVGLKLTAGGTAITWERDPEEMYAIHLDVPAGVDAVEVSLDFYLATSSATPNLMVLNWNQVLLYPQGIKATDQAYMPTLRLPAGWKFASALPRGNGAAGDVVGFAPVSLYTLVDSPLIAGVYFRSVDLSPGAAVPHALQIVTDSAAALEIKPEDQARFSNLTREGEALFGSYHYRGYQFLLSMSDQLGASGLEHHESSDDHTDEGFLTDEVLRHCDGALLPHEMVHSWNGKYRRPADIVTPDYQTPMKTELLWVYEGLTQYLGQVLAARSGLWSSDDFCQNIALSTARLERQAGREWRPLADTAVAAQVLYKSAAGGRSRRRGVDFYDEGALIWLEADVIIRQQSHGQRSLDDFCRKFYGPPDGEPKVVPYTLDDLVAALNEINPYDWRKFFAERVYAINPHAPIGGIEGGGWRVVYSDTPSSIQTAYLTADKVADFICSLGFSVKNQEVTVRDVIPNSPADKAGIVPDEKLVAVNGRSYTPERLKAALKAAKTDSGPIDLLVQRDDFFASCKLDYHGGEQFAHLERDETKADVIGQIVKPILFGTTQPARKE